MKNLRGQILLSNHYTGMYAVRIHDGAISVFELRTPLNLHNGDTLTGCLDSCGDRLFFHEEKQKYIGVFVHQLNCSPTAAFRLIGLGRLAA